MPRSANAKTSIIPGYLTNDPEWKRGMATWAAEANQGHLANTGTVTLLSGTVTTVLTDSRIGAYCFVGLMPQTSNAAGAIATTYIASQSQGGATITHASAATGDRTFRFCILG
jgi:hypothetical protein